MGRIATTGGDSSGKRDAMAADGGFVAEGELNLGRLIAVWRSVLETAGNSRCRVARAAVEKNRSRFRGSRHIAKTANSYIYSISQPSDNNIPSKSAMDMKENCSLTLVNP